MFGKLLAKIKSMARGRAAFDPSCFDDPVAMQTAWTPAKGGGTNFRTHKLVATNPERVEFRASGGAMLFYSVFLLAGLGVLVGMATSAVSKGGESFWKQEAIGVLIGSVFAVVGGCMWYFGTAPIVFDRRKGWFWKGRKAPDRTFDKSTIKHLAKLEEIHALQLLSEYCRGDKSSYYSYELNLVLEDGRRINVIDHGNEEKLRADAEALAEFLGVPVWDAM